MSALKRTMSIKLNESKTEKVKDFFGKESYQPKNEVKKPKEEVASKIEKVQEKKESIMGKMVKKMVTKQEKNEKEKMAEDKEKVEVNHISIPKEAKKPIEEKKVVEEQASTQESQQEVKKAEIIEEINGKPIEAIIHLMQQLRQEITDKRKQIDEYASQTKTIKPILKQMLERELHCNQEIAEPILMQYQVHPKNESFQSNYENCEVMTKTLQWIQQCFSYEETANELKMIQKEMEDNVAQVECLTAQVTELERTIQAHEQSIQLYETKKEAMMEQHEKDKTTMMDGFRTKFEEIIQEKETQKQMVDDANVQLNQVKAEKMELESKLEKLELTSQQMEQKYEAIIQVKDSELFELKQFNERLLEENQQLKTEMEMIPVNVTETIQVEIDSSPDIEIDTKTEEVCEEIVVTEDLIPTEVETVQPIEEVVDETDFTEEEYMEPENSDDELSGLNYELSDETGEVSMSQELEEQDETENEVEKLLAAIVTNTETVEVNRQDANKEAENIEFKNVHENEFVHLLESKEYQVEMSDHKEFSAYIIEENEKTPLLYVYYDMDSKDKFNEIMQETDKIYLLFKNKQYFKKGNEAFTSWLLKNKERKHTTKFSMTTMDELKVSGLDKLDTF